MVGTQVDSSDVSSELLDAIGYMTAPGRAVLVSTQVYSNDEFVSQFAVQDDVGARNHGGVAVVTDDFSQPRLKRL